MNHCKKVRMIGMKRRRQDGKTGLLKENI